MWWQSVSIDGRNGWPTDVWCPHSNSWARSLVNIFFTILLMNCMLKQFTISNCMVLLDHLESVAGSRNDALLVFGLMQLYFSYFSWFRLGSKHDGQLGSAAGCDDINYIMAYSPGGATNLLNRYLFSCCSQRSFYGVIAKYVFLYH